MRHPRLRLSCLPMLLLLLLAIWPHRKAIARRRKCPGSLSEDKIIREVFHNYTKMLPESDAADESVHVQIEMHVQDMGSLNEISADFEIDILFTQLWHDPNLSFRNLSSQCVRNITMESRYLRDIWTPNTCIINAKRTSVHASPTDNIMFILYENGTVWINHRLSVKAPCNLDLRTFPFDTQTCTLLFESYSHNSEEVTLHWMEEPITLMKQITLPDFDMIQFVTKRETLLYPNGYWDELQASFTFKRRYGFYILQAYVPTYLTIIVSWVGFCMEPKALPARTTVGVSSLLALTLQFGNIHKNLPRVSYVKAMDVWMLGCISFVFGTMIELAMVCYITRCQSSRNAKRRAAALGYRRNSRHHNSHSQHHNHNNIHLPHHLLPSRRSLSALFNSGEMLPEGMQSCLEANMFGVYGGGTSSSRSSSMRVHTMPVMRNGALPQQRKISSGSSLAPLFKRRKRRCANNSHQEVGGATLLPVETEQPANGGCSITDRPQLVLPTTATTTTDERRQLGNGDLLHHLHQQQHEQMMPKSVSGHSLSVDQRSLCFLPDQLDATLQSGRQWMPSVRGKMVDDNEENWPIIQPESIDKLSIVFFPLAFTLFNLIYWWYYLSLGGQFDPLQQTNGVPSSPPPSAIDPPTLL